MLFFDAMRSGKPIRWIAVERAAVPGLLEARLRSLAGAEIADATDLILRLRKRKESDEIEEIRGGLRLNAAAYICLPRKDPASPGSRAPSFVKGRLMSRFGGRT